MLTDNEVALLLNILLECKVKKKCKKRASDVSHPRCSGRVEDESRRSHVSYIILEVHEILLHVRVEVLERPLTCCFQYWLTPCLSLPGLSDSLWLEMLLIAAVIISQLCPSQILTGLVPDTRVTHHMYGNRLIAWGMRRSDGGLLVFCICQARFTKSNTLVSGVGKLRSLYLPSIPTLPDACTCRRRAHRAAAPHLPNPTH